MSDERLKKLEESVAYLIKEIKELKDMRIVEIHQHHYYDYESISNIIKKGLEDYQ